MEAQRKQAAATRQRRDSSDSDLEHLSLMDIEAAMNMSVTDAVFSSVLPHYPIGAHIQCCCQVSDPRDLADGCWIGLFKVGWSDPESDCFCQAECRREGDRTLVAVFTQTQLPKDTQDFYQFCFVAPDRLVKGASSPFLFRGAPSDDFVAELDEELQGVVVSARTAQLENSLANMRLDHEALRSAAQEETEQLRRRLSDLKDELRTARELAAASVEQRSRAEARVAEAETEAGRLRAELESRLEDLHRLDESRQATAARLIGAEDERQRLLRRLEEAVRETDAANNEAEAARKTLEMHAEERRRLAEQVEPHRAKAEALAERLRRAEILLADAVERERRLVERTSQAEAASETATAAVAEERAARQQLEAAAAQLRSELAVRPQQEAVSTDLRAQQARYASLLTAYEGVKQQFHGADDRERLIRLKYDEVIDVNKQMLLREERLHAKLAEMRGRLMQGGAEYKKLMKKCRDLQRQQPQLQQQASSEFVEQPDEFHDAQGDELSLSGCEGDAVIYRPPAVEPPRSLPEAAAAVAAAAASATTPDGHCCPVCLEVGFPDQRAFEEHVYAHFPSE